LNLQQQKNQQQCLNLQQQKNQQHLRLQHHQQIKVLIQETAQEVVLRLQRQHQHLNNQNL
ncbi:NlpC/P60 family lipoprotein, partial [Enterococcus faecium]